MMSLSDQVVAPRACAREAMVPQHLALRLQLAMFAGCEPNTSCLELRGLSRSSGSIVRRAFIRVYGIRRVERTIADWAVSTNVFIGCAPRTSYTSGTLNDIERVWCLWCDCDSAESSDKLRHFKPRPSIVVRSGSPGRHHAYWQLSTPLSVSAADRANRRLARALGADSGVCDATRVLRPIGSINHKHGRCAAVECVHLDLAAYAARDVVGALEDDEKYKPRPRKQTRRKRQRATDGLVQSVANAEEGSSNKVLYWAARRAAEEGAFSAVCDELADAALEAGLDPNSARSTLRSAQRHAA